MKVWGKLWALAVKLQPLSAMPAPEPPLEASFFKFKAIHLDKLEKRKKVISSKV